MEPFSKPLAESSQKNEGNTCCSIIGKTFITDKNISFFPSEVIQEIKRVWVNLISAFTILYLGNDCYRFNFENEKDKRSVMDSAPWLVFANQYVFLLKEWCNPDVPPSKMEFTACPFWIQVYNIPARVSITQGLCSKISQITGYQVVDADFSERKRKRNMRLRIRVVVDVTKRLATGFWYCFLRDVTDVFWVSFRYENLPKLCYRCGMIGHGRNSCVNDELAKVPVNEQCIVNYEGAVPSRVSLNSEVLEEDESKRRGYGPWLFAKQGHDHEDIEYDGGGEDEVTDEDIEYDGDDDEEDDE